ncbi:MAG: DUF6584 family protein [Ornithinibacter sp.]
MSLWPAGIWCDALVMGAEGGSRRSCGVVRARMDLDAGDTASARHRLKGYLVDRPTDLEARRLLAQAYRMDGQLDAAGLWGYLEADAAAAEERAAFESSCLHRRGPRWVATSTVEALKWPVGAAMPESDADQVLARLNVAAVAERAAWELAINPAPLRIAERLAKHLRAASRAKVNKARRRSD